MTNKLLFVKTLGLACLPIVVLACAAQSTHRDLKWKKALDGGCAAGSIAASAPVLNDGVIYVGSSDGAVYAIGANTGKQIWRFQTGAGLPSGTGIIIDSAESSATDMLGKSLEKTDEYALRGKRQITATPVFDNKTIYIGSWDHSFYALDAMTGNSKWAFPTAHPIMEKAIMHGGKVIFVTGGKRSQNDRGDGLVYALDASSGKSAWIFDTLPDVEAKRKWPGHLPVVKSGVAYVTNWNATNYVAGAPESATVYAHAIDGDSGEARWSSKINAAWPSPPVVTDNYVLFLASSRDVANSLHLHALDIATGVEKWTYETAGGKNYWQMSGVKKPLVANGNIVILITDIAVVGVDLDTGKERWRVADPFQKKPINEGYLGPLLYVLTGDTMQPTVGTFYAMDTATGATAWTMPMNSRNSIRAVIDDVVYVKTAFLRNSLITVDGISGEKLGTAWTLGFGTFTNESSGICAGPVRYGDQLLVSTELQLTAGAGRSLGYLYSVKAPTRHPQKNTHE